MPEAALQTVHRIITADGRDLSAVAGNSVDLIVTSPPYPMIAMWDGLFSQLSGGVKDALDRGDGDAAFNLMHAELDKVWHECFRVLKNGSFACINIGDAVRSVGGGFRLYSNHSRITGCCAGNGFDCLPVVIWRKQTNAPNKFMGSGMLPAGAYVTLEHEYILIFRKGAKKEFASKQEKLARMRSAFFWEERNTWFSDVWDFKGTRQELPRGDLRDRSAAFPLELAWRLVNMYSLRGDTVLDPFSGTGTVMLAALAAGRSSIGVDIDETFAGLVARRLQGFASQANSLVSERIGRHMEFVKLRESGGKPLRYTNAPHGFPVMTAQETELQLQYITGVRRMNDREFAASYEAIGSLATEAQRRKAVFAMTAASSHQTTLDL